MKRILAVICAAILSPTMNADNSVLAPYSCAKNFFIATTGNDTNDGGEGFAETRVAGYGKVLSTKKSGWQLTDDDNKTWDAASPAFIREVVETLRTGKPHRNHARESIQTFESMMALAQAAVDGGIVKLPMDRTRDPLAELNAKRK